MRTRNVALRLVVAAGIFGCVVSGGCAADTAWVLWRSPPTPTPATAAAPDHRWVLLQDAVLECPSGRHSPFVLARDGAGGPRFLVYLADPASCPSGPVDGAFIGAISRALLKMHKGLRLPPGEKVRVFSQLEAPRFLRRRLGTQMTWFCVSLLVTMLGVRALWSRDPAPGTRTPTKSGRARLRE